MNIVTRAQWGFDGWAGNAPASVNEKTQRTEFFTHYQGGPTGYKVGVSVPRSIHAMHKANGWKGIGYGHVVDHAGTIYEGRGFGMTGSHCPNHNVSGYSAQGHIGTGETPSPAMLASIRWLYEEAGRRSGRTLAKKGHRDGNATACPGDVLYAWVKAGMPAATITTPVPSPEEDDMPYTEAQLGAIVRHNTKGAISEAATRATPADRQAHDAIRSAVRMELAEVMPAVAAAVAALPAGVTTEALTDALRTILREGVVEDVTP